MLKVVKGLRMEKDIKNSDTKTVEPMSIKSTLITLWVMLFLIGLIFNIEFLLLLCLAPIVIGALLFLPIMFLGMLFCPPKS